METIKRSVWIIPLLLLISLRFSFALQTPSEETVLVGHIAHVEGELLRYLSEDDDWVATVQDAPCGTDDLLYADKGTRAELIMPNNIWVRIGYNTQVQIIELTSDLTSLDIDSGIARLYNKSADATIKATTPFGAVTAPPHSTCDITLTEDSILLTSLRGTIDFFHVAENTHYGVTAGSSSLCAGFQEVASLTDSAQSDWDYWNKERDDLWEERFAARDDSKDYLPETLHYGSYTLEENGRWENVYYEGSNYYFWRPLYVSSHWSPFTVGRWSVWYGDHCWIPYEPFGYITHHYGNWVYIDSCSRWYWAPPHCHRTVRRKHFLDIGFGWYPGRVAWIHRGGYVGWIPLAPFETYYSRSYWGPGSYVVHAGAAAIPGLGREHCRFRRHAIVVKKHNLYKVTDYNRVRMRSLGENFITSYQRAAFVNSRVMKDLKKSPERFGFGTGRVQRKPPVSVLTRMERKKRGELPHFTPKKGFANKRVSQSNAITKLGKPPRTVPRDFPTVLPRHGENNQKIITTLKRTIRKPRLPLKQRQTRTVPKIERSTQQSPRRSTFKSQIVPRQDKKRSPLLSTSRRKRTPHLSGLKGQRSGRQPPVKASRLLTPPRLRGNRLSP